MYQRLLMPNLYTLIIRIPSETQHFPNHIDGYELNESETQQECYRINEESACGTDFSTSLAMSPCIPNLSAALSPAKPCR